VKKKVVKYESKEAYSISQSTERVVKINKVNEQMKRLFSLSMFD